MKRQLLLSLAATLLALPSLAREAFYYTYAGKTLTYTIIDENAKTCRVEGSTNVEGDVVIPEIAKYASNNYTVTVISFKAFFGCRGLTSVSIPNSVTEIGDGAFSWCTGLKEINVDAHNDYYSSIDGVLFNKDCTRLIQYPCGRTETGYTVPNSVSTIGYGAFLECTGLTSITIPNSVTKIGEYAFYYCTGLTSVIISNSVTSISNSVFHGCSSLTSVIIPPSVTSIGSSAFRDCYGLTSVTIPNSVTSISNFVFHGCSSLTSVIIPPSVTSIGSSAFRDCYGLTSVTIPNSVTIIGELAFFNCSGLNSVVIPNSVTSICYGAFNGCIGLTEVNISEYISYLGNGAFGSCESLKAINVAAGNNDYTSVDGVLYSKDMSRLIQYPAGREEPEFIITNSVSEICECAFENCRGLTSITIPNSVTKIGDGAFSWCTGLTSVSIPNSVKNIGKYAFSSCSGLTSVIIPNSVNTIGNYAFDRCSSITSVTYLAENPVSGRSTFSAEIYPNATLNYLKSAEEKIASTEPWSRFVNRIGRDADYSAISEVEAGNGHAATAIYNLRGVKVGTLTEGLQRGIYITNGRKIFVR